MYKISNGIIIKNIDEVLDLRLNIKYQDKILTKLLSDINTKQIYNLKSYIDTLNISTKNKKILNDYKDFCIKRKIIKNGYIIFNTTIWKNSRVLMSIDYIIHMFVWIFPIFPIILIDNTFYTLNINSMISLYIVHLFTITIHELGHSLSYWSFQNKMNGYFDINYCSCSFNYNEELLKPLMRIVVAISGIIFSLLFLCLMFFLTRINRFIILIEIVYQLFSFILGTDVIIVINTLKNYP